MDQIVFVNFPGSMIQLENGYEFIISAILITRVSDIVLVIRGGCRISFNGFQLIN